MKITLIFYESEFIANENKLILIKNDIEKVINRYVDYLVPLLLAE
jgi:hypothetical protein